MHEQIILNSHRGVQNQLVLFEFGSNFRHFIMVRGLCIYVPSDLERRLLSSQKPKLTHDL